MSSKNPVVLKNRTVEKQTQPESETETAGTAEVIHEPIDLITDEKGNLIGGIGTEKPVSIVHKGFQSDDIRQKMVQYAYKLGGMDFVTMIECENGNRNIKAVGDGGKAHGLCQIHTSYHYLPEGYKDTRQVQIEYCYKKRSSGTVFYGPSRKIKGQRCSSYVLDRFIINNVE